MGFFDWLRGNSRPTDAAPSVPGQMSGGSYADPYYQPHPFGARPAGNPLAGRRMHVGASNGPARSTPTLMGLEQVNGAPAAALGDALVDRQRNMPMLGGELLGNRSGATTLVLVPSGGQGYTNVQSLAHWGGNTRIPNRFSPKLGYQASLTSYGFPNSWDTLRLVVANPNQAQGLQRRTRPVIPAFGQRGGGYVQIPGAFVPIRRTGAR